MDKDQLDDLKQFITATVSQATAGMATKDDLTNGLASVKGDIKRLEAKGKSVAGTDHARQSLSPSGKPLARPSD